MGLQEEESRRGKTTKINGNKDWTQAKSKEKERPHNKKENKANKLETER